jgi:hypothetical protein
MSEASSVFRPQCGVCQQFNPAGAKFCIDCGSPLLTKRCGQCDAVNDHVAKICSECATEFPSEAPPRSSAQDGFHYFDLDGAHQSSPSAANSAAPASIASVPGSASASPPEPELVRPAAAIELAKVDPAFDIPSLDTAAPLSIGAEHAAATVQLHAPEVRTEPTSKSRVALATSLSIAALVAIGGFAYYVYDQSVRPVERHGEQPTATISAPGAAKPAPPSESSAGVATAPVGQDAAPTPASSGGGDKQSTGDPHPQVPASDPVSPVQKFADKANGAAKGASAATADAGNPQDRTPSAEGDREPPKYSATRRPIRTSPTADAAGSAQLLPRDSRAPSQADKARPCTEGIAALGLCSANSEEASK